MALCAILLFFFGLVFLFRKSFLGIVFGIILLGNAINLAIFFGSSPDIGKFAFVSQSEKLIQANDPLPQALVLTAIVIGFALLGFLVALIKRLSLDGITFDSDLMREEGDGE